MGLWYRRIDDRVFQTMDLVPEFLDIWLQTRRPQDIKTDNIAGVIDALYDFQPVPGQWIVIEARPKELGNYINVYINAEGKKRPMMRARDTALSQKYVQLLEKGYEPTPIMIAGAGDKQTGEEGIVLIDGRHRIFSAIAAGRETILAYIPLQDLPKMDKAIIQL